MEERVNFPDNIERGQVNVVSTETHYGLDGLRFETGWRRDFPHLSRWALGPTQPPVQWIQGPFPSDKAAKAWR